jgi:hypothetical protein
VALATTEKDSRWTVLLRNDMKSVD